MKEDHGIIRIEDYEQHAGAETVEHILKKPNHCRIICAVSQQYREVNNAKDY